MQELLQLVVKVASRTPHNVGIPQINGPAVFGVSPGKPCLFTFPVCGEAPLHFEAEGDIPQGIELDPNTGRLYGQCDTPGRYTFHVKVRNALGCAEKDFTLCVEKDKLCLTPLLGWTSWNAYMHTEPFNQETIARTAELLVEKGLSARGFAYVNIDSCWQGQRDEKTKALQPNKRFYDMKALVDHIHSCGLKAGIYSTPMVVAWGSTENEYLMGSTGYPLDPKYFHSHFGGCGKKSFVENDVRQWAEWGFDYLKYDWTNTDVDHTEEVSKALRASGRDFVLSVTTWCQKELMDSYKLYGHMFRSNYDTSDTWVSIARNCFSADEWAEYVEPGSWFDMDMLALGDMAINGNIPNRLSRDEKILHVSAWAIFPAPMQISCDLSTIDEFTLDLLSNEEILAVNQDYPAKAAVCIRSSEERSFAGELTAGERIYRRELSDGRVIYGFFNTGDTARTIEFEFDREYSLRDLWARRDLGSSAKLVMVVPSHGARVIAASDKY